MRQSVIEIFPEFSKKFEGRVAWMYLDIKGLVTTGVGNLIDPVGAAMCLPFVHRSDMSLASPSEIAAEWSSIKHHVELAKQGHRSASKFCKLMLTDDSIDVLVRQKLLANEKYLRRRFAEWDEWSADAQLAVLSMAWAMGAGFTRVFKTFTKNCETQHWADASANCSINSKGNPGVIPRNAADRALLLAAQSVKDNDEDPEPLYGFAL